MAIQLDIAANYHTQGDLVNVTLFPRDGTLYRGDDIVSGQAKLLYTNRDVLGNVTNVELARAVIDATLVAADGTFKLQFNHPPRIMDLKIEAQVVIGSTTYTKTTDVLQDTQVASIGQNDALPQYEEFPPDSEERDSITQLEPLDPIRLHVDLDLQSPLTKGDGAISYTGGGHRYLPDAFNRIIEQDLDEAPWTKRAATFLEDSAANLLANNDFAGITGDHPVGYVASDSNVMLTQSVAQDQTIESNYWSLRYRLGSFTSPTVGTQTPIAIDVTKPTTCSMFLGVFPQLPDRFMNLKTITLKVQFFNAINAILGTKDVDFNAPDLLEALHVVSLTAIPADYPVGTAKIGFQLVLKSFVSGDDCIIRILLPQIVQVAGITSFVRGLNTRQNDVLTVQQANNLDVNKGGFITRFIPGYTGYNPGSFGGYIFDTRHPATKQNGFTCRHTNTGQFEFVIDVGGIEYVISSIPVSLSADTAVEIKAIWDKSTNIRRIYKDNIQIASDSGVFSVPTSLNTLVYIGARAGGDRHLNGQYTECLIMRSTA